MRARRRPRARIGRKSNKARKCRIDFHALPVGLKPDRRVFSGIDVKSSGREEVTAARHPVLLQQIRGVGLALSKDRYQESPSSTTSPFRSLSMEASYFPRADQMGGNGPARTREPRSPFVMPLWGSRLSPVSLTKSFTRDRGSGALDRRYYFL
jgi:hypothetical protein